MLPDYVVLERDMTVSEVAETQFVPAAVVCRLNGDVPPNYVFRAGSSVRLSSTSRKRRSMAGDAISAVASERASMAKDAVDGTFPKPRSMAGDVIEGTLICTAAFGAVGALVGLVISQGSGLSPVQGALIEGTMVAIPGAVVGGVVSAVFHHYRHKRPSE